MFFCTAVAFAATSWHVEVGMNACDTRCGVRKDQTGLHFVGMLPNATACANTCEDAPAAQCGIWLFSAGSSACWWRTDGIWKPTAQADVTSACRESAGPNGTECVAGCGSCPAAPSPAPSPLPPVISGQGQFRYRYEPRKLVLPPSVELVNGHGVAKDAAGNIYFTYESANKGDAGVRALLRFAPDGTGGKLLGNATLAQGVPHGIKVQREADGKEYLYHANNAATVTKTTLDGDIIWRSDMTAAWQGNKSFWPFKPTDLLIPPGEANTVLVADGYGLSKVHSFDRTTGEYTGQAFGGKGDGSTPGQAATFDCNHGLSLDDRPGAPGKIVVSDRSNHRLVWIGGGGTLLATLNVSATVPLPCNAQTSAGTSLGGEYLVVPGLGVDYVDPGPWLNGSVSIYNGNNVLVSNIEVARHLGVGVLGHTHPHDAIFLGNGDLVVAVWKGHEKGSLGGLEYWTRLSERA